MLAGGAIMIGDKSEGKVGGMVEGRESNGAVKGYQDLRVYNDAYDAMLEVYHKILPKLPRFEYDLIDQLRRSCKAVPRLIGEGHAKRYQVKGFQKYIYDALAEANETMVSLSQARDLYSNIFDKEECNQLIGRYDRICRQLYSLSIAWQKFSRNRMTINPSTNYHSRDLTHRQTTNIKGHFNA